MTRAEVDAWADTAEVELLFADGFDDALIGIGQRFERQREGATIVYFLVYDAGKVLETLRTRDGMSDEEAVEFYEFNITGAFVGDATPCFVMTTLD
jgi:hypothetical protein